MGDFLSALTECFSQSNCRRGGSNPYTLRYRILSPARLPIPPLLRGPSLRSLMKYGRSGTSGFRNGRNYCRAREGNVQTLYGHVLRDDLLTVGHAPQAVDRGEVGEGR